MSCSRPLPRSYGEASALLGGRASRKLRYKTWLIREHESRAESPYRSISIVHHEIPIVTFRVTGLVEVDLDGWRSLTTLSRVHEALPWLNLVKERDRWYCSTDRDPLPRKFRDGMIFDRRTE